MYDFSNLSKSAWLNPITVCFGIFILLFLSFGMRIGAPIAEIAQHIFIPYLFDMSRIGNAEGQIVRAVMFVSQLSMISMAITRSVPRPDRSRRLASTFGIALTIFYFILVAIAYILLNLH